MQCLQKNLQCIIEVLIMPVCMVHHLSLTSTILLMVEESAKVFSVENRIPHNLG